MPPDDIPRHQFIDSDNHPQNYDVDEPEETDYMNGENMADTVNEQ